MLRRLALLMLAAAVLSVAYRLFDVLASAPAVTLTDQIALAVLALPLLIFTWLGAMIVYYAFRPQIDDPLAGHGMQSSCTVCGGSGKTLGTNRDTVTEIDCPKCKPKG